MRTLSASVAAWPCSSKAMTTAAAPNFRQTRALRTSSSGPSLRESELTMGLPWTQRRPASRISHLEESTITGTRAMSGSTAASERKRVIAATPSIIPSSKLTSMTAAPFSTCCLAISRASPKRPALTRSRNFLEPATLVRSPTFTKAAAPPSRLRASRPARRRAAGADGTARAAKRPVRRRMAAMCSGVVPQQPPTRFTSPSRAKVSRIAAVSSGPSGKPVGERGFGRPALG